MEQAVYEITYSLYLKYLASCKEFGEFSNEAEEARKAFCVAYSIIEKAGPLYEIEYQLYKEQIYSCL